MDIETKKAVVADFIAKCNDYADRELARYRRELESAANRDALAIQDKICHWTAYRTFNEHTLRELESETLDDWLR
jgi:hypothetical protein